MSASKKQWEDSQMGEDLPKDYFLVIDADFEGDVAEQHVVLDSPTACNEFMGKQIARMQRLDRMIDESTSPNRRRDTIFNEIDYRETLIDLYNFYVEQMEKAQRVYDRLLREMKQPGRFRNAPAGCAV